MKRTALTAPEGTVSRLFRLLRIGIGLGALLVAFLAATLFLFVFPHTNPPGHADAVIVLSGGRNSRLDPALKLMQKGVAPLLVISGAGLDPKWPKARALCRTGSRSFKVYCFDPVPYSTRGEAREIAKLAAQRHWHKVDVVTSGYHIFRARIVIQRCYHGRLAMIGASYPLKTALGEYASEWAKLLYQLTLQRSC